jgi:hypothetical protein
MQRSLNVLIACTTGRVNDMERKMSSLTLSGELSEIKVIVRVLRCYLNNRDTVKKAALLSKSLKVKGEVKKVALFRALSS